VEQDGAERGGGAQDDAQQNGAARDGAGKNGAAHDGAQRINRKQGGLMQAEISQLDGTLAERMGIKITELSAERVVGTMPVAGNTQSDGPMHGGAACVLAETLGSSGSAVHGGPGRAAAVIEISATHHRPAASGEVTGVATRIHGGNTLVTYDVEIMDVQGQRVCTARLTCRLRDLHTDDRDNGGAAPARPDGPAGRAG
jgi:1,4-dihydroxy-2-naphthoyl-CoA hydrolase